MFRSNAAQVLLAGLMFRGQMSRFKSPSPLVPIKATETDPATKYFREKLREKARRKTAKHLRRVGKK